MDSIIRLKIEKLKKNGVSKIGYTKGTCVGYGVFNTVYLFYKKSNSIFIQKFENSEFQENSLVKFKPLKINDSVFFTYYERNRSYLIKENVKHFRYKPDSIVGNTIHTGRIMTAHSCHRHFIIEDKGEKFNKQFDFFDLKEFDKEKVHASKMTKERVKYYKEKHDFEIEDDSIYENYPVRNISFEYNQKLKIVEWDKTLKVFIKKLESQNLFKEIKKE